MGGEGPALCCNVILPPTRPDADAGFVIMEQVEYPPMSGSNTICVTTALIETGMVAVRSEAAMYRQHLTFHDELIKPDARSAKNVPPEVLEWRYPVRVERFELRRGSGGRGRFRGGEGKAGTPRHDLGLQMKEDALQRLIEKQE